MAPAMANYDSEHEAKVDDIPVLDLLNSGSEKLLETVRKACEELGCFRIINHGIAADVLCNADSACRDVFKLPTETKKKNVSSIPFASYFGGLDVVPFYESLGIPITGASDEAIKDFSNLMWPDGNQNFCKNMEKCMNKMITLSKRVHHIILESFGVSQYYASHFNHDKAIFRMNMYKVTSELSSESIGVTPHTDGNSITILYEDGEGGLQVWNKAGHWVEVKPIPNALIVFLGDSFQAWTNGLIHSVKHQVIVKKKQSRLSFALFSTFPDEMEIKAPPEFIDDEHPRRYKAFKFKEMIAYRSGEGKMIQEPLQSFAGVYD